MVLQDNLGQVVDEIYLVPELSTFFPFRRNFCSLCPRLTGSSKPLKALSHSFYGQRLLFWVNGLIQLGHFLSAQPEMWLCPGIDHCGFSLQFLYPKYAQMVTPPAPISLHCFFFIGFSLFLVIQVKCKVLNALLRDSLAAMLSWQCCRNINCTIFEQAQGGKLSELILLSEPSCAKSKMFGFSIKLCCILFFSWFGWLWVCTHFI